MFGDVLDFRWGVPTGGFRAVRGEELQIDLDLSPHLGRVPEWVLIQAEENGGREYQPDKLPFRLFKTFVGLARGDHESALGFANEYGTLDNGAPAVCRVAGRKVRTLVVHDLDRWEAEREVMATAVHVWECCEGGRPKELGKLFRWVQHWSGRSESWMFDTHHDDRFAMGIRRQMPVAVARNTDVLEVARAWLRAEASIRIDGRAAFAVIPAQRGGGDVLACSPDCLLSFLWFQFARALTGNRIHHTCRGCGRLFEVSSGKGGRTVRAEFCRPECKFRDYRQRVKRAGELHAAKWSLRQIADELGSNVGTVKEWIARGKKAKGTTKKVTKRKGK
jgi:hypothetical protein